jgi:tetratricopeptide (TPR) repeat protein
VADIFVSYTSADRDWAFWIGQELLKLGHAARIHEWEIKGGEDVYGWMQQRIDSADHMLCVTSEEYLTAPYSTLERNAALWKSANSPGFALIVVVRICQIPALFANLKRYELHALDEHEARARLAAMFMVGKPAANVPFPGTGVLAADAKQGQLPFPGTPPSPNQAISNVPINVPRYFLGRDEVLAEIRTTLASEKGRVAITALFGMRGVGKTTLAAAYAEQHRADYRATWWIRAETDSTMRADLVGLGVRLGWVAPDDKEEPAVATVMERLRYEGAGILLIFDNAIDSDSVEVYLPNGGDSQIIITSNAHAWRDVASPMEIDTWPNDVGAEYLVARTGRMAERQAALDLSDALGGLPLAHEQVAAYCERLEVPLATYHRRFDAAPVEILDDKRDAPRAFHNRLTAAKAFAMAIDEAAKLHPAAESLIVHAALLAPEPIPLFLFSEAREEFGEPLASNLAGDGLDEAVAALRAFALLDRETIPDERDPSITTDCIRLHRLVRQVAAMRFDYDRRAKGRRELIEAMSAVYPSGVHRDPGTWPRARRLDSLAMALVAPDDDLPVGSEPFAANLLSKLDAYRDGALAAYAEARTLSERALAINERTLGPDHPATALCLNNLGYLLQAQGDLSGARPRYERALMIREKVLGPDHLETALSLNNLGYLLRAQGSLSDARPYLERALSIHEKLLGPAHPDTAMSLNNLGALLRAQGDLSGALPYYERALAIHEKVLGPDHPDTASSLNNLGHLLQAQGDFSDARRYLERALAIREKAFGPDHPDTATSLNNLGGLLEAEDDLANAQRYFERALAIRERALGPDHPDTATSLNNLGYLLQTQTDLAGALPYFERALSIFERALGATHPTTKAVADNTARLLEALKRRKEAKALREKFGIKD